MTAPTAVQLQDLLADTSLQTVRPAPWLAHRIAAVLHAAPSPGLACEHIGETAGIVRAWGRPEKATCAACFVADLYGDPGAYLICSRCGDSPYIEGRGLVGAISIFGVSLPGLVIVFRTCAACTGAVAA